MSASFAFLSDPDVAEINVVKYLRTNSISLIHGGLLEVSVAAASVGSESKSIAGIDDVKPIAITSESKFLTLNFENFVSYSVADEMFAEIDECEVSEGGWIRIYSQSHFLDYVKKSTWATAEFPGELIHYQINTLDHSVDIVTSNLVSIV